MLEDLETQGYLIKTEPLKHSVGHCHRCHSAVEPLISEQWFVKMEPLAKPALEAVRDGQVTFVPEVQKDIRALDGEYQRLVYFQTALVGPQDSRMVLRRLQ